MKTPNKKRVWLFLVFLLIFGKNAYSKEIPKDIAINCILGEGRLEYSRYGYNALLALAEGLRNRGYLEGVNGCKVNFEDEHDYMILKGHYLAAEKAWIESEHSNLIQGAQFWGSVTVDQEWIKKMKNSGYKLTYKRGNHVWYKK